MATLLEILTSAADKADVQVPATETFVTRTTAILWLNELIKELHRLVTATDQPSVFTVEDFTIAAAAYTRTLTTNYTRFLGLTLNPDTTLRKKVDRYNFAERDSFRQLPVDSCHDRQYSLVAKQTLHIQPQENAAGVYRAYFVPVATTFAAAAADGVTLDAHLDDWVAFLTNGLGALIAGKGDDYERQKKLDDANGLIRLDITSAFQVEGEAATVVDVYGDW